MEVINTTKTVYQPVYDPLTDKYTDLSPFECHSRNNIVYTCLCNHKDFNTLTTFKTHIKTKSHLRYIENYKLHIEESADAKANSNDYQCKFELSERKLNILSKQYKEIQSELLHYKFLMMVFKYKMLKTDRFEDCVDTE